MSRKKRIEPRVGKPESVGSIFEAFIQKAGYAVPLKEWEVVSNWEQVAGEQIARRARCERVEDGVLYVKVESAPWRQELSYMKDMLKESALKNTGCRTIKDIVFY